MRKYSCEYMNGSNIIRNIIRRIKKTLTSLLMLIKIVMWSCGIYNIYYFFSRKKGAVILMYHSITDDENKAFIEPTYAMDVNTFIKQMEFLNKKRNVISLSQLINMLEEGRSPERGTIIITFDDGYQDNYRIAAPILEKYNLPATIFLATGYVSRTEPQWIDELYYIFNTRTNNILNIDDNGAIVKFDLGKDRELINAREIIIPRLVEADIHERKRILSNIYNQLIPAKSFPKITLSWDDVREMLQTYPLIEIGCHTHNHISMTTTTPDLVKEEIELSKKTIERQLGFIPEHFSYPYGRANRQARDSVIRSGFKSAAITDPVSFADADTDIYSLSRLDAPKSMTLFKAYTYGAIL